jgi:hypothetical protein
MKKGVKIGLIVAALALLGYAGYKYFSSNADKLMDMTYRFQNFKILKASLTDFQGSTDVVLTNPSDLSFTVTSYDINVEIEKTFVASIVANNVDIVIPAQQSVTIPINIQFDPRKAGQTVLQILMAISMNSHGVHKTPIHFTGKISGKYGPLGFHDIPVDYTYEV